VSSTRWLPGIDIGAEIGRLTTGRVAIGPSASIELPIFDQQRAVLARLEALTRQTEHKTAATAIAARSEVRVAFDRLLVARRAAHHYKTVMIPLREQIVALSQKEYGAMLLGVYQLIQSKQAEISAYREYIEIVREYWAARSELERAVGGRLPAPPKSAPSPDAPHHHGG
jgi:cobalt-zinc-cadmium efflux system outer membrane protein